MSAALSEFGATIGDDDREIAARKARQQRHWARERARLGFAEDMDVSAQADPAPPGIGDEGPERGVLWKLRRVYDWDGRMAERERQARIAAETDMSAERWQEYRRNWNRLLERAAEKGVHVIYMHGYESLRHELTSAAGDAFLDERTRQAIRDVLARLQADERARERVENHRDLVLARMERRREDLEFGSSWDKRPFPDREYYKAWREGVEEAVAAAEGILANRRVYGPHLDGMERSGRGGLEYALSIVREVLRDDDRHIAETLAGQHKGEDARAREERIARLLDDPEKLRERRKRLTERKAEERRRKGRYQSRGMSM